MKRFLFLLLPLLAIAGLLAPALGSADSAARAGTVVGVVLAHGMPVADVPVMIEGSSGNVAYFATTRTDRAGRFHFRDVPPSRGVVRARARGLHDEAAFTIRAGEVVRLPLDLHR